VCLQKAKDYSLQQKVAKAQVCVVGKVIIFTLNHVVTCVMNQSHGHWLLSNALTTAITLTVNLQFEMAKMFQVLDGTKALNPFYSKVFLFQKHMRKEIMKIFKPFFQFLFVFYSN